MVDSLEPAQRQAAPLELLWLGRIGVAEAWARMDSHRAAMVADATRGGAVFLMEHPPVLTLGRSASRTDVLMSDDELARRELPLRTSSRGGGVTYHGPGQLVGYPVVRPIGGPRAYISALTRVLVAVADELGVHGARGDAISAGLWVDREAPYKLASMGVSFSRGVTTHGFALYVEANALDGFSQIVPCATPGLRLTTLARELGRPIGVEQVVPHVGVALRRHLAPCLRAGTSW